MPLLNPRELELSGRVYLIGKWPAIAGREIIAKYPLSALPKIGDYAVNEETMLKLMAFVGVKVDGRDEPQMLTTRALIDNHIDDWETLAKIEITAIEYNCSFFGNGRASGFFDMLALKAKQLISQTLMDFSAQSSQAGKRRSKS